MTIDLTGDAAIVLADFGQAVTYTAYGESGVSITAVFSGETTEDREYIDGRRTVRTGDIYCASADVTSPDLRDTFAIAGATWQVDDERGWQADNSGGLTIRLIRSTRKEISGPDFRRTL